MVRLWSNGAILILLSLLNGSLSFALPEPRILVTFLMCSLVMGCVCFNTLILMFFFCQAHNGGRSNCLARRRFQHKNEADGRFVAERSSALTSTFAVVRMNLQLYKQIFYPNLPTYLYQKNKGGAATSQTSDLVHTVKVGGYFALWYGLNIGYNIYNKKALNALPLPWTVATFQLFAGIPYVLLLWLTNARTAPKLSRENLKNLTPSALCHLGTHVGAVLSLGAGAVSFTHIVKASEPVVSAALSAIFLKQFLPVPVYLSLLPVIGGVALASMKELSFTWIAFSTAMLSNVASAMRAILSKVVLFVSNKLPLCVILFFKYILNQTVMSGKPLGENLTPLNL
jgi:hypothetical protein